MTKKTLTSKDAEICGPSYSTEWWLKVKVLELSCVFSASMTY